MALHGRPTKYDPSFIEKVDEYLQTQVGRTKLPTRYSFAQYIGVNDDSLDAWEKQDKNFFRALKKIENAQREKLMDDGLYGGKEVNPGMAIFLLKVNHGMIETSHTDVTSKGEKIETNAIVFSDFKNATESK